MTTMRAGQQDDGSVGFYGFYPTAGGWAVNFVVMRGGVTISRTDTGDVYPTARRAENAVASLNRAAQRAKS